jgi:uncharacterized protein (DUF2236 family)
MATVFERQAVWVPAGPTVAEVLGGAVAGIGTVLAAPLLQDRVPVAMGALLNRPVPRQGSRAPSTGGRSSRSETGATRAVVSVTVRQPGDSGWFGPDSVAWKVHADTSILVAGMAAFALQALHPLALAGVADHSSFADDFLGRTRRTGEFVSGVVYGTSDEAQARVATVQRVHERVVGVAPDGRPYSANDPELLEWVHVTEYLAIAAAYRRFALFPLSRTDLDRYVGEVAVVGEAMGVSAPPRTWGELDAAFQRFRPQLAMGEQAVAAVRFLQDPPGLPDVARAAWHTVWHGAVACLPPLARNLLHLPAPGRRDLVACRALVRALGTALGPPPPLIAARRRLGLDDR